MASSIGVLTHQANLTFTHQTNLVIRPLFVQKLENIKFLKFLFWKPSLMFCLISCCEKTLLKTSDNTLKQCSWEFWGHNFYLLIFVMCYKEWGLSWSVLPYQCVYNSNKCYDSSQPAHAAAKHPSNTLYLLSIQ